MHRGKLPAIALAIASSERCSDEWFIGKVCVRQAVRTDLTAMEWEGEYKHFRRIYAEAYASQEDGEGLIWIAEFDPVGLIGQVFISFKNNRSGLENSISSVYLYGFRVKSLFRNRGVGSKMMRVVEADLIQRGFTKITLNVSRDNPGARRLYERLGYEVTAPEAGHWNYIDDKGVRQEVYEPAWRMEKRFG